LSLVGKQARQEAGQRVISDPDVGAYCCSRWIAPLHLDGVPTHEAQRHAVEMGVMQRVSCLDFARATCEERVWLFADAPQVSRCGSPQASEPEPERGRDALGRYRDERVLLWANALAQREVHWVFQIERERALSQAQFCEPAAAQVRPVMFDSLRQGVRRSQLCCWVLLGDCSIRGAAQLRPRRAGRGSQRRATFCWCLRFVDVESARKSSRRAPDELRKVPLRLVEHSLHAGR
jgi:hypothetical protein